MHYTWLQVAENCNPFPIPLNCGNATLPLDCQFCYLQFETVGRAAECLFAMMNGGGLFKNLSFITTTNHRTELVIFSRVYFISFVVITVYAIRSLLVAIIKQSSDSIKVSRIWFCYLFKYLLLFIVPPWKFLKNYSRILQKFLRSLEWFLSSLQKAHMTFQDFLNPLQYIIFWAILWRRKLPIYYHHFLMDLFIYR